MIVAFAGDPFLVRRSARQELRQRGFGPGDVLEVSEGLDPAEIGGLAGQAGLFGSTALLLDFAAAFQGPAGVAPRKAAMKALEGVPSESFVAVLDPGASAARQKAWRAMGTLQQLPTPRYGAKTGWIAKELKSAGVRVSPGVPALLGELFGDDLPAIASEVEKLAVLDDELDEERVRTLVHRPAARDAFDMIAAITAGDQATAVGTARRLLQAGEAPPRILGALAWQFARVAGAVALLEREGDASKAMASQLLGVAPYVAGKALEIAHQLDERALAEVFGALLEAEVAVKSGRRDAAWGVEALALDLSGRFARRRGV